MFKRTAMALLAGVLLITMASRAEALTIVDVGSGTETSHIVIAFYDDGVFPAYQFNVSYNNGDLSTGLDLITYLADSLDGFSAVIQDFGWGQFVDGLAYDGFDNEGYLGDDFWWHYWVREAETDPWDEPVIGAADRTISNGSWDGWVYGSALDPIAVPEPASALLILGGASLMLMRRRAAHRA